MGDRIDPVGLQGAQDQLEIADIADHERHALRHGPSEAGRQVVEYDGLVTRIEQGQNHMAADISCPTGDENVHEISWNRMLNLSIWWRYRHRISRSTRWR
jgi:hypothetical protein